MAETAEKTFDFIDMDKYHQALRDIAESDRIHRENLEKEREERRKIAEKAAEEAEKVAKEAERKLAEVQKTAETAEAEVNRLKESLKANGIEY